VFHHHGIAAVHQLLQHRQEFFDVFDVQPDARLVVRLARS
jgi:hypothetical protein